MRTCSADIANKKCTIRLCSVDLAKESVLLCYPLDRYTPSMKIRSMSFFVFKLAPEYHNTLSSNLARWGSWVGVIMLVSVFLCLRVGTWGCLILRTRLAL